MRIAFLSTFYPYRGGIAQFNADLLEALGKENEVKAFTFTCQYPSFLFPGKSQYVTEEDNAKVVESEAVLNSINPFSYCSSARTIIKWNPDLVVMGYWMSYLAPSLGTVAKKLRRKGIKVITVLHNVIPHEPKFFDKPLAKWFLKQNDACMAMCKAVLSDVKSLSPDIPYALRPHPLYNHFGEKMTRETAAAKLGIDPALKTILFFGLIRDYKGLDLLIEAFRELDDTFQLVIAGECYGNFDKYATQIEKSGCRERIKVFNHFIATEEVPLFFSSADLCVLPYRSATQSGVTAISLHFDVPMVATRVGGLSESVEDPGVGLMTENLSADAIADAIRKIFTNGLEGYVQAIARTKQDMTWDNFAKELLNLATTQPVYPWI